MNLDLDCITNYYMYNRVGCYVVYIPRNLSKTNKKLLTLQTVLKRGTMQKSSHCTCTENIECRT